MYVQFNCEKSRDSPAGVVTELWVGLSGVRIPEGVSYCPIPDLQTSSGISPSTYLMGNEFISLRLTSV